MKDIRTESKNPNSVSYSGSKNAKGTLKKDKDGHYVLVQNEEPKEKDTRVEKAISLKADIVANIIAASAIDLAKAGAATPRLDAEILLGHALELSRTDLVKKWTDIVSPEKRAVFESFLERRRNREPVAYITGIKSFYNHEFVVDDRVLIPRPETEKLVELGITYIKQWSQNESHLSMVDVGTGAGEIALSIAKEVNYAQIYATDISADALKVAEINARLLGLDHNIGFYHGDLLAPLPHPVNLIIANLPYIPESKYASLEPEIVKYEPKSALVSGEDGLDHYRRMFMQVPESLLKGGKILIEVEPYQVDDIRSIALSAIPTAKIEIPGEMLKNSHIVIVHT